VLVRNAQLENPYIKQVSKPRAINRSEKEWIEEKAEKNWQTSRRSTGDDAEK
jgi:hypothetical protein